MKYQKYVDSQKKECNGRYLNKGSGHYLHLSKAFTRWPTLLLSTLLFHWSVESAGQFLERKYSTYECPALYHGL